MMAPGVWKISTPWLCPADPISPVWLIDRVQRETPSPELIRTVLSTASSASTPEIAFAEGFLHRRLGKLREAEAAFLRARQSTRPIAPHATINLGNLRLWAGDPEGAEEFYEQVLHDPQAGMEARYNLAIALSRQHRFEEADKQLDKASRLDFERFRSAVGGEGTETAGAVDGMLSPAELWTLHARGRHLEAPTPPLLLWVLPAGRPEIAPLVLALAVLAGGLMGNLLRRRLQVHDCHRCGAPVCRRCVQRIDGRPTCAACAALLGRLSRPEARRAALGRLFDREPIREARLRSLIGLLMPGIGPILYGKVVAGTFLSWLAAFGALLFTRAAWAFPPSPATGRLDHDLRSLGLVCVLCAWALSVAAVRRARRRRSELSTFESDESDAFQAAA
jgi:tetratricopeptide (TPR) repeat protein